MSDIVNEFNAYRLKMNEKILDDANMFKIVTLYVKIKKLLGAKSICGIVYDDWVKYHLQACYKNDLTRKRGVTVLSIANLIGGTIVIPHLCRAYEFWEVLEQQ